MESVFAPLLMKPVRLEISLETKTRKKNQIQADCEGKCSMSTVSKRDSTRQTLATVVLFPLKFSRFFTNAFVFVFIAFRRFTNGSSSPISLCPFQVLLSFFFFHSTFCLQFLNTLSIVQFAVCFHSHHNSSSNVNISFIFTVFLLFTLYYST